MTLYDTFRKFYPLIEFIRGRGGGGDNPPKISKDICLHILIYTHPVNSKSTIYIFSLLFIYSFACELFQLFSKLFVFLIIDFISLSLSLVLMIKVTPTVQVQVLFIENLRCVSKAPENNSVNKYLLVTLYQWGQDSG